MKNKWFIIAVLFPFVSFSQGNVQKGEIAAIASVGLIAGESTAKPLFQLSGGLAVDRWYAGIGFGLDRYRFSSMPLFADWRMSLGKRQLAFLYGNAGYNFPTRRDNKKDDNNFFKTTDRFYGGFYMDAGVGYRIRLSPLHRLLLSAGYSRKELNNKVGYTYICWDGPCPEEIYNYHYKLGRIMAKISWEFGKQR
jgi:hypothetical protein